MTELTVNQVDVADIIRRVVQFQARGLSTFQAMAAALEDSEWDLVFETLVVSTVVMSKYILDEDHGQMLKAAIKITSRKIAREAKP